MILGLLEGPDLIVVLVIVMVMFGAKRVPELARSLGHAKREFDGAIKGSDPEPDQAAPAASVATAEPAVPHEDSVTLSREQYELLRDLRSTTPTIHNDERRDRSSALPNGPATDT